MSPRFNVAQLVSLETKEKWKFLEEIGFGLENKYVRYYQIG